MSSHDTDFDADWYLSEYPDVRAIGMDPYEHYRWLGRRLNRLPFSPGGKRQSLVAHENGGMLTFSEENRLDPYCDAKVALAFEKFCSWLIPESAGHVGLDASAIFHAMRWDFGHHHADGQRQTNPLALKLVDFMRSYDSEPNQAASSDLRGLPGGCESILLASYYAPTPAHAGGLRILDTYTMIRERCPDVRLTLFAPQHGNVDGDLGLLEGLFDEIHICRPEQFRADWLLQQLNDGQQFDLADLQFHQAGFMASELRTIARRTIFTPMETLSRFAFDEARAAARAGQLAQGRIFAAISDGAMERKVISDVDMTVCVSDADASFLASIAGTDRVSFYPTGLSKIEFARELKTDYLPPAFEKKRNRLVFAAYFGSETNRYGLEWYLENVHPLVLAAVPDYDLAVVGRGDTSSLERYATPYVRFIGEVPNLAPVLEQAKAGLVLALNGSGFRGKINQYALCGLPSISTTLGATGLTYEPGTDILIADGVEQFSKTCIDLLLNDDKGVALATKARQRALEYYSWGGIWPRIAAIYGLQDGHHG
jgi:glycosyltransferase involved in cell wall biosynthesis